MPDGAMTSRPALEFRDLAVRFPRRGAEIAAVNGVSFALAEGEVLTILGESGSGKSVSLRAAMRLLPATARLSGGISLNGQDLLALSEPALARLRGRQIAMIVQEPITALDPVYAIGEQIAETIVKHEGVDRRTANARVRELFDRVRIPSATQRLKNYPHELSGGMRQRAMIALALACSPSVLLADEPTTALDVTIQIQILLLLRQLQAELGMAIVLVTHDVGVAAEISDRIAVMYAGRFVEEGRARQVLKTPRHPYTESLLASSVPGGLRAQNLETIPGNPPDPTHRSAGCAFVPRCRYATHRCTEPDTPIRRPGRESMVRCVRAAAAPPTDAS